MYEEKEKSKRLHIDRSQLHYELEVKTVVRYSSRQVIRGLQSDIYNISEHFSPWETICAWLWQRRRPSVPL